ncbi:ATP-binding protein [Bacillus thuringiensis]|nr:ATP-binding protein [Bacillus thuringiensis]
MFKKHFQLVSWDKFFEVEEEKVTVYRIIPHSTILNNQSYKLWRTLHGLYTKMSERLQKDGMKLRYKTKERIWFDISFRSVEKGVNSKGEPILEKKIEFFLACPSHLAEHVKHHFEHHYRSKNAGITLEEIEIESTHIPEECTNVCDLKLKKHNIFSIESDYSKQTTPISFLLNCIHDVRGNDMAKISICAEPYNRLKWNSSSKIAFDKFQKGKTPKRTRIDGRNIFAAAFNGLDVLYTWLESMVNEIIDIVDSMGSKEKRDNYYEKQKHKQKSDLEKRKILIDGKLSTSTNRKQNAPVFKTHIRVASHSINDVRREMTKRAIVTAFDQLSENNELESIELSKKEVKASLNEINNFKLTMYSKSDIDTNIFSNYELGKITQLPTSDLQREYEDSLIAKSHIETDIPSIFIHKEKNKGVRIGDILINIGSNNITCKENLQVEAITKENGLLIGHSELKGNDFPISIPNKNPNEFYKGYVFQGQMGAGKDTAIQNFVVEGNLKHNIPFVIIDQVNKEGREGMANGIRDSLPPEKIVDLDLSNEKYLPPLDLTEVMKKLGKKGADRFANELIQFFDIDDMGQSKKILRNFAKACNGSLYKLQQLLEDETFRKNRIVELRKERNNRLADELDKYTSQYEYNKKEELVCTFDGQRSLDSKAAPILNRLDTFLGDDTLYSIFAQPPKEEMAFEQWMKEGKVILIRVPDRVLSQVAVKTLVHWITLKVFMTRLLMDNESQSNGCFIVFNEPQTYLKDNKGLADLMARIAVQGRKERLGSIFACHHIGQIKEIADDLISGGVHWFLFKNDNKKTFESLETELKPNFDIETAMRTPKHHAINILNFGGDRKPAFLVKMLPPSYERYQAYDNSFLTKRHAELYGRKVEEIESLIVRESA